MARYQFHFIWNRFINQFIHSFFVPIKLDIQIVEHCNLNCKGCSHFSPIAEPELINPEIFEYNLKKLKKINKYISIFQLLGGEPLLHPQLAQLFDISRKYLPHTEITLITNGILFLNEDKLPSQFWESCKRNNVLIKITKYPINLDFDKIIEKIKNKGIRYIIFKDKSVRWSFFPLYENGFKAKVKKFRFLKFLYCDSFNCFQLVGNRIYPCSQTAYIRHLNKKFNKNFLIDKKDYVEIDNLRSSFPLRKLLVFSTPFCKYCGLGCEASKWGLSAFKEEEWIRK